MISSLDVLKNRVKKNTVFTLKPLYYVSVKSTIKKQVTYNKWDSEHLQIWGQIQNILRHHSIEITIYPKQKLFLLSTIFFI